MALTQTLFGEWEDPEPIIAPKLDEGDEPDDWHSELGPWQAIAAAPKAERVDLWIEIFEFSGEVVEDCWWNEGAVIPDWYRQDKDGKPELAVPIFAHASYWKPPGADGAPVFDGGPGFLARQTFDDGMTDTWPPAMRDRYTRYIRAVDDGEIERELTMRGLRADLTLPLGV